MEILYLLIPLSVILVFAIAVTFWISVRGGQFDDLEGPGFKVLMDDDRPIVEKETVEEITENKTEEADHVKNVEDEIESKKSPRV